MDSCARGAFLSGVGFLVSLKWLQAARVSISAVATSESGLIGGAHSAFQCASAGSWFRSQGD
jgi:hypothetical protein